MLSSHKSMIRQQVTHVFPVHVKEGQAFFVCVFMIFWKGEHQGFTSPFLFKLNLFLVRSNRVNPRSSSSFFIFLLSAGCDRCRISAASDKVPVSAKVISWRSSYNSNIETPPFEWIKNSIKNIDASIIHWHCTFFRKCHKMQLSLMFAVIFLFYKWISARCDIKINDSTKGGICSSLYGYRTSHKDYESWGIKDCTVSKEFYFIPCIYHGIFFAERSGGQFCDLTTYCKNSPILYRW